MRKILFIFGSIALVAMGMFFLWGPKQGTAPSAPTVFDPLNATYTIDGEPLTLIDGVSEVEAAPGSAIKATTKIFGVPTRGDLDGDGREDAALTLIDSPGGTGTFFYVVAALNKPEGAKGTNAIFLGDRIAPQTLEIRNGLAIINYADRKPDEPMTAQPSVGVSRYAIVKGGKLTDISTLNETDRPFAGMLVIGHEARTFTLCEEREPRWILGESPALKEIMGSYEKKATGAKPYTALFAILTGRLTEAPSDGFGADYRAGFFAQDIVDILPETTCK